MSKFINPLNSVIISAPGKWEECFPVRGQQRWEFEKVVSDQLLAHSFTHTTPLLESKASLFVIVVQVSFFHRMFFYQQEILQSAEDAGSPLQAIPGCRGKKVWFKQLKKTSIDKVQLTTFSKSGFTGHHISYGCGLILRASPLNLAPWTVLDRERNPHVQNLNGLVLFPQFFSKKT